MAVFVSEAHAWMRCRLCVRILPAPELLSRIKAVALNMLRHVQARG